MDVHPTCSPLAVLYHDIPIRLPVLVAAGVHLEAGGDPVFTPGMSVAVPGSS
jgi:hypothetical protein